MARIRKTVFWATRAIAILISFLFSAVQLTPPAWAKAVGAADPRSDAVGGAALTALIADLSRSDGFDRRLGDELDRLEGVGGAGEGSAERPQPQQIALTLEGKPLQQPQQAFQELAPLPKVLPQAPQAQPKQAPQAQPQQAITYPEQPQQAAWVSIPSWSGKPGAQPKQVPWSNIPSWSGKPRAAPGGQPQQIIITGTKPAAAPNVQPQQLPAIQPKKR